jgi:hypothetical protein
LTAVLRLVIAPIFTIYGKSSTFPASISKIAAGQAKFLLERQIPAFSVARSFARQTLGPPPGLFCPAVRQPSRPRFLEELEP